MNQLVVHLYPISAVGWERGRRISLCVVIEVHAAGTPVERTGRLRV